MRDFWQIRRSKWQKSSYISIPFLSLSDWTKCELFPYMIIDQILFLKFVLVRLFTMFLFSPSTMMQPPTHGTMADHLE